MRVFLSWTLIVFSCFVAPSSSDPQCEENGECTNEETNEESSSQPLECRVYMAPSTLGEIVNMGMYTGVDLKEDELIQDEIAIPLFFRHWGKLPNGVSDGALWSRYIWEGITTNHESYSETNRADTKSVFVPGIGCTINGYIDMNNIYSTHGSTYDNAGMHRSKDPGVGSFSSYHASETTAAEDIPAGSELFAAYGIEWIPNIPGAQITYGWALNKADAFLEDEYIPFVAKYSEEMSDEMKEALWNFTSKDFPIYSQLMTNLPRYPWPEVEQFVQEKALAAETQEAGNATYVSITRDFIRKNGMRSQEWLTTHPNSYCQDHIYPKTSTIPQAGRGAFATRDLPKGTVIGYSPLIHIGKYGRELFDVEYNDVGNEGKHNKYDLIINYSFGHNNSSMILTPYGGMVNYINHGSGGKANVKVRWPDKELVAHKPWFLEKDPDWFSRATQRIGLSFEYVALRDIEEGEEVLMDYGPEWEKAWEEHVKTWEPLNDAEEYVHSAAWPEPFLRTQEELEDNPYPDNLRTMCSKVSYRTDKQGENYWVENPQKIERSKRWYCDVLNRHGDEEKGFVYDVEVQMGEEQYSDEWLHVKNFNSSYVFLTDKPFTTDWHMPNVFRHPIAIPDNILPSTWNNYPEPHKVAVPGGATDTSEPTNTETSHT